MVVREGFSVLSNKLACNLILMICCLNRENILRDDVASNILFRLFLFFVGKFRSPVNLRFEWFCVRCVIVSFSIDIESVIVSL